MASKNPSGAVFLRVNQAQLTCSYWQYVHVSWFAIIVPCWCGVVITTKDIFFIRASTTSAF